MPEKAQRQEVRDIIRDVSSWAAELFDLAVSLKSRASWSWKEAEARSLKRLSSTALCLARTSIASLRMTLRAVPSGVSFSIMRKERSERFAFL